MDDNQYYDYEADKEAYQLSSDFSGNILDNSATDIEETYDAEEITYRSIALDSNPVELLREPLHDTFRKEVVIEDFVAKPTQQTSIDVETEVPVIPPPLPFLYILEPTHFTTSLNEVGKVLEIIELGLVNLCVNVRKVDDYCFKCRSEEGEFRIRVYNQSGSRCTVEFQRRNGCSVAFSKLYHHVYHMAVPGDSVPAGDSSFALSLKCPPLPSQTDVTSVLDFELEVNMLLERMCNKNTGDVLAPEELLDCLSVVLEMIPTSQTLGVLSRCSVEERCKALGDDAFPKIIRKANLTEILS